jgi:glutathione S-transferase
VPAVTLWHVPVSHYSEKVRWALDRKRVPHRRRALLNGVHPLVALVLTRGAHATVPVLALDGRAIGDSTAILAALEARFPDPPLLPADPAERERALALEDWFDEHAGAYVRRLVYHDLIADPDALDEAARELMPWVTPATAGVAAAAMVRGLDVRFGVRSVERARTAEEKVLVALDRLEAELDGRAFLCGGALSVADVAAAALLYPLVLPPEGPWHPEHVPPRWRERMDAVRDRRGVRWVAETYARWR